MPDNGINMFAVIMHTHELGKKVRLRQIRGGEELSPTLFFFKMAALQSKGDVFFMDLDPQLFI